MEFRIESSSGVPITRQIADQIRTQVASGSLTQGDRLPSVRELARDLAVNQNTILRVYERLTAEGLLERRHGAGTYVSAPSAVGQLKAQHQILRDELGRLVRRAKLLGITGMELHALLDEELVEPEEPAESSTEAKQ
jgi:GntR family transcriptional regulator